jgi:hypothetical protein
MNSIAATSSLPALPTRFAPALEEERTAAASPTDAQAQQNPKFSDVVAILNPLQNLPIVGTIYRKLTDDVPHPAARAIGGLLWGGPMGLLGAVFSYVAEQVSGKTTTEIVQDIFGGQGAQAPAAAEKSAAADPPQAVPAESGPPSPPISVPARGEAAAAAPPAGPTAVATPPQPAAPRNTGGRDLAYYQARAGMRLPPASTAAGPSGGPQAATPLPSFQRPVTPVLASDPLATAARATAPVAAPVAAPVVAPGAAAATPPSSPQDFMQRMLRGIDQYQALNRGIDAQPRAARLDRVE